MTWFETEEIAKYIFGVENSLDDWQYDRSEMKTELAELDRAENKIKTALQRRQEDKTYHVLADEVLSRIRHCRQQIQERLME